MRNEDILVLDRFGVTSYADCSDFIMVTIGEASEDLSREQVFMLRDWLQLWLEETTAP